MRKLLFVAAFLTFTACRDYDSYHYLTTEKGMLPPDQFASYGPDQAITVAIGREFGQAHSGNKTSQLAQQIEAAVNYARTFPQVKQVVPDTLGHRLVVTFADGWSAQIIPITDGKKGSDTPGLPSGQ